MTSAKMAILRTSENSLLHKSNENTGKNCQKQLFSELGKLTKDLQQSGKHLLLFS